MRRPMGVGKTMNEYAAVIDGVHGAKDNVYEVAPKAVIAAVAVSLLSCGGDNLDAARDAFIREWWTLHENGIVPQKPPFPKVEG